MDKAIFLQKQVRDNSEDLQKELSDMLLWEEQMKKKDFEIRNTKDDQVLPPVRSKKKKKSEPTSEVSKDEPSKAKRIAGSDYKSWDQFDVDKACKEVEAKNHSNQREEKIYEIPSQEELDKEHAEATKYKEEGNVLVQKKEYAKAVGKYSQAIKIFPHDAVFFANRGLCQLKLDNFYSAESDCTQAIKLDGNYVKAYHRRATARIELKCYADAQKDLEKILELEPTNKEAATKLKQVQEKVEKSKKSIMIAESSKPKSNIEKAIAEKMFNKKTIDILKDKNDKNKSDKENTNNSVKTDQVQKNTSSKGKLMIEEIKEKSEPPEKPKQMNLQESDLPPWLPKLKAGISIVQPLNEVPRQTKKILKSIPIQEISDNESIFKDITDDISEVFIKEEKPRINDKIKDKNVSYEKTNKNNGEVENVPPPPKSSVGFLTIWSRNTSLEFRYKYLMQIVPKHIPHIFKASMESNVFSDILCVLNKKFMPNGNKVYDWLYYLSKLERFKALILFMSETDKEALKNLIECCKTKESRTDEEVNDLYSVYEM